MLNSINPSPTTAISSNLPLTERVLEDARILDIFNQFLEKVELNQKASFNYQDNASQSYSLEFGVSDENGFTKEPIKENYNCTVKNLSLYGKSSFDKSVLHKIDYVYFFNSPDKPYIAGSHQAKIRNRGPYTIVDPKKPSEMTLQLTKKNELTQIPNISYQFNDKKTRTSLANEINIDSLASTMNSLVKKKIAELEKNKLFSAID